MLTAIVLLSANQTVFAQTSLSQRLTARFSNPWNHIQRELEQINEQLSLLPDIPSNDQGGTRGLAAFLPESEKERIIDVHWGTPETIDMVSLVPARTYDASGLLPEYGLPGSFTIDLLDADGQVVGQAAQELSTGSRRVCRGFPFTYSLPQAVIACGVRIHCKKPKVYEIKAGSVPLTAWAELFCFSGNRNVAEGAAVTILNADSSQDWKWRAEYLVDGLTPLGLPELPEREVDEIGWISYNRESAFTEASVEITLDAPALIDGIRLFPAQHIVFGKTPGFGFPQQFSIYVKEMTQSAHLRKVLEYGNDPVPNPGQNPVTIRFPAVEAQLVYLLGTQLWKPFPDYPAYLAFSEVQVLHGESNLTENATVWVSDNTEKTKAHGRLSWSPEGLINGAGPNGRLAPTRLWLQQLDRRYALETRRHQLHQESNTIETAWRRRLAAAFGTVSLLTALATLALPIRYRIRERRQVQKLRRRIADDLHDEVGANLSSIAGSSELLEEIITDPSPKQRELMGDIANTARKTVAEVRLLINFLDSRRVEGCLLTQLNSTANQMLGNIPVKFRHSDEGAFNRLPPIDKWNLLLFFKESLHNIVKHAESTRVDVETCASGKQLQLIISDNGRGLSSEQVPAHLMSRAAKIGAKLQIESSSGKGTKIQLNIPRKRVHKWNKPSH
jgi:signal transduction histidine kinase